MRYAVLGGDLRFAHLVGMLKESGREAAGFLNEQAGDCRPIKELAGYSCIISNWPLRQPLAASQADEEEIMNCIAPGSVLLLCGPQFPAKKRWDLQYIDLWQDETLLRENAWITAEGAAASAMQRMGRSLTDMKTLVVGCGRIGYALAMILRNLGANVTVVSGSEAKRRRMTETGISADSPENLMDVLPSQKLIFSTPPAMVLDRELLNYADRETLIIDLASPPYGVDLDAALELGLDALREPGLPGRCCPMGAARAICSAVLRWEEAEKNG